MNPFNKTQLFNWLEDLEDLEDYDHDDDHYFESDYDE